MSHPSATTQEPYAAEANYQPLAHLNLIVHAVIGKSHLIKSD